MTKPGWVSRSPMADLEAKIGLQPLDELLAARDDLVESVADLRAAHGPFGLFEHKRKIELARIAGLVRARAVRDGIKMTAAEVDDAAHCHPDYLDLVTSATVDRANLYRLESKIADIDATIQRANVVTRWAASEPK